MVSGRVVSELLSYNRGNNGTSSTPTNKLLFPKSTSSYTAGMLRVPKTELMETYDMGVPYSLKARDNSEALIIYNTPESLPSDVSIKHDALFGHHTANNNGVTTQSTAVANNLTSALENCDALNIMFTDAQHNRPASVECTTIIGDFESYHKNRWVRIRPKTTWEDQMPYMIPKLDKGVPLRHVGRITMENQGIDEYPSPPIDEISEKTGKVYEHWKALRRFFENVYTILDQLKTILDPIVKENTVVVMTVNKGQSLLLTNFVCNAHSRGFDISNVLVFPTDEESRKLAEGLGLAYYYDEINLGHMPEKEATYYGDDTFAAMMFAKILCVYYINLLGYDVLFQDVDITWLRDPLEFFHNKTNAAVQSYDIAFQHDGSPQPRFAPYSANSGFYYVRWNKRTQYLFTSFLYHGDLVATTASHQQVLVELLLEHASMFGLKVKVFDKVETDMFPGGYHFHRDPAVMKSIVTGNSNAYIFHMSWTENKSNKILFLRQLGEWYVHDKCVETSVTDILEKEGKQLASGVLEGACCSAEPIISCHYRDKPSKIPCNESPPIDMNGASFW